MRRIEVSVYAVVLRGSLLLLHADVLALVLSFSGRDGAPGAARQPLTFLAPPRKVSKRRRPLRPSPSFGGVPGGVRGKMGKEASRCAPASFLIHFPPPSAGWPPRGKRNRLACGIGMGRVMRDHGLWMGAEEMGDGYEHHPPNIRLNSDARDRTPMTRSRRRAASRAKPQASRTGFPLGSQPAECAEKWISKTVERSDSVLPIF